MPAPRFSIIVPLYNKADYIEPTLSTVLAQTFEDFEVLVIDDGSTDDGAAQVASISDPRIKLHRTLNGGVSRARNRGIELAQGEWIAFLDADDWLHPHYLETLAQMIEARPSVQMAATRYRDVPFDTHLHPSALAATPTSHDEPELIDDLPRRWLQAPAFFTSSVAVKRTLLAALQPCFPEGESFGEDLDAWFRLSGHTIIALHPSALVWRFIVPNSLTSQARQLEEPPFLQRLLDQAAMAHTTHTRRHSLRRFVRTSRLLFAREAIFQQRRRQALRLLGRSFAWHEPRWWLTAVLLMVPAPAVQRWHQRRNPSPTQHRAPSA